MQTAFNSCRCCHKLVEGRKNYVNLFGEKAIKEGIIGAVRKYGDINIVEDDIGVLSTKICRGCYSLVTSIMAKVETFSNICKGSSKEKDSLVKDSETKRSVAERSPAQVAISPSVLPQVKRSRHVQVDHEAPHMKARVSLFQSRPILPKTVLAEKTSLVNTPAVNTEVINTFYNVNFFGQNKNELK